MRVWLTIAAIVIAMSFVLWRDLKASVERDEQRARAVLEVARSPACRASFGRASALRAEREYQEATMRLIKELAGHEVYPDPHWEVVCPTCSAVAVFDPCSHRVRAAELWYARLARTITFGGD